MICCINAECQKPLNSEDATHCRSCGAPLVFALRGRYRPVKLLGQGGFGRTYLAHDQDRLNSKCVIKQFAPQVRSTHAKAKAVSLFNQEAVRLHELGEHPQIPALLAYFEEGSYLYLVQQYIEGPSLAQELSRHGPLNENRLRQFLTDLLPVLQFVHSNQVIHRDITPMNILRRSLDSRVVLIDFGVAKQLNMQMPVQPGTRIGTEGYSPMEQFRGGRAYPASDLYSLGATCLHLLTNTRPDFLYDPLRGEWIWQEHLQDQQRPISAGLTVILNKLLQDMVSDRYQSALDVLTDLNNLAPVSSISVSSAITIVDAPGPQSASPSSKPPDSSSPANSGVTPSPAAVPSDPSGNPSIASPASASPTVVKYQAAPGAERGQTSPPSMERSPQPTSNPPNANEPNSSPPNSKKTSPPQPPVGYRRSRPPSSPPRPPQGSRLDDMKINQSPRSTDLRCECLFSLPAHSSWVTGISISPDGSLFATSGLDDQVKLWNFNTGRLHRVLLGHSRGVNTVAFSQTRGVVLSGSDDYTVKVWNSENGTLIQSLSGHQRDVTCVVASVDDRYVLSGGADRSIRIWDMVTGRLLKMPIGVSSIVRTLAVSPDGQVFVSGGMDRKIKLWSMKTAELAREWMAHKAAVTAVTVSASGQLVGSVSKDQGVKLWNLSSGRMVREFVGHQREVNAIAIAPDNQWVISGGSDASIRVWEVATGKCAAVLSDHASSVNAIAIHPSGQYFISGSSDCSVKVWQLA